MVSSSTLTIRLTGEVTTSVTSFTIFVDKPPLSDAQQTITCGSYDHSPTIARRSPSIDALPRILASAFPTSYSAYLGQLHLAACPGLARLASAIPRKCKLHLSLERALPDTFC